MMENVSFQVCIDGELIDYIVPEQVKNIEISDEVKVYVLKECREIGRTKVILLGRIDNLIYFTYEKENAPKYANSPMVSVLGKNNKIDLLDPMDSITIKNKARKLGVKW